MTTHLMGWKSGMPVCATWWLPRLWFRLFGFVAFPMNASCRQCREVIAKGGYTG